MITISVKTLYQVLGMSYPGNGVFQKLQIFSDFFFIIFSVVITVVRMLDFFYFSGRACSNNPCQNGGSCTDVPPDYQNHDCSCPPNVFGENCETGKK